MKLVILDAFIKKPISYVGTAHFISGKLWPYQLADSQYRNETKQTVPMKPVLLDAFINKHSGARVKHWLLCIL